MKYRVFWNDKMDNALCVDQEGDVFYIDIWTDTAVEHVADAIVMPCTGLHDYGGNDIYDGDILQGEHGTTGKPTLVQITWAKNEGWWSHWDVKGNYHGTLRELLKSQMGHTYKVVGNIHENPELLR